MTPRQRLVAAAVGALALIAAGGPSGASDAGGARYEIPDDFLGLVSAQIFNPSVPPYWQGQALALQRHAGVELLRQEFDWATIEPRPGVYHWSVYDTGMKETARAGMHVLAIIDGTPPWAAAKPRSGPRLSGKTVYPPRQMEQFARFAALLVRRYGPGGSFWRAHPHLPAAPIHSWEIWNEPNFKLYWGGHPSVAAYAAMLRAVSPAIRAVEAGAEIVTGGVAGTNYGIRPERYIRELLAVRPQAPFDTLAIHDYAPNVAEVVEGVRRVRAILDQAGLRSTPIWVTELGWASGGPPTKGFTVGPKRQAYDVLHTIVTLAQDAATLHVRGIVYYDWEDSRPYAGGRANLWQFHTGLVKINGIAKRALSAYYQAAGVVHKLAADR